jgi:POB3-like N-terminal PH domain
MSSNSADYNAAPVVWKHIGLHGFAVGTLALTSDAVVWKSAVTGRDDGEGSSTTRKIPAAKVHSAQWTVFGKTGLLRLQIASDARQHEWRLDGFPVADFDALKGHLQSLYAVDLKVLPMSAAGAQYGITKIQGKLLTMNHCVLQDDLNEEGQEFEVQTGDQILSLDLTEVSQCVLPGNNRNELELQFPETDTMEAGTDQLGTYI